MTETYVKQRGTSKTQMAAFEEAREIELQIKELVARKERVLKAGEMAVEPVTVFRGSVPETTMGKIQLSLKRHGKPVHIDLIYADLLEMGYTSTAPEARQKWDINKNLNKKLETIAGKKVFVPAGKSTWGLADYDAPIVDFTENRGRRVGKRK